MLRAEGVGSWILACVRVLVVGKTNFASELRRLELRAFRKPIKVEICLLDSVSPYRAMRSDFVVCIFVQNLPWIRRWYDKEFSAIDPGQDDRVPDCMYRLARRLCARACGHSCAQS